ncbi:GNAT family N-acetyltransferase [Prosthecochloris marina]|uniref:GNAT family N-acetyltransferase n=1 Tax=Prosthecochloris marina TaxID=2017681 RepID=A0A317TBJ2_9CHLB|nr:GNAT family N-acetyltransferase [Prosthecochloris marina]PWW83106.1 GNAT family N-acetyltransferase [Prosthecochloris marina]
MNVEIKETKEIPPESILELYKLNKWSSAEKPNLLYQALIHSNTLISAWIDQKLVGIANAISDGHLVVYYPHFLIHPDYQGKGIGKKIMEAMQNIYGNFHQQMLMADEKAIGFYKKCGFEKAGKTESMWIYQGNDH